MADKRDSNSPGLNELAASTISRDLTIIGNVTSKGEIHLDGHVQGDIHCVSLFLGENAQLEGGVIAEDVVVRGRLIGQVRALRVTLQSTSHVEGDIFHQSLAIEQGAYFEGASRRSESPLSPGETVAVERLAKPQSVANASPPRRDKPATVFTWRYPESA